MTAEPVTLLVFGAYLVFLVIIGLASSKKSAGGLEDFFLAGRNLNKWTVALSAVSSGRSGWLILGVSGMAFLSGFQAIWAIAGYITAEIVMFFFVARRFREYSQATGSLTIPDLLESRFPGGSKALRVVSALILVFFMVAYVGSQVVAGGTAFSSTMGLSQTGGMWLTAAILLFYVMIGGFHAVSKTDVLQAGFMFASLVILPIIAIINLGGFGPILEAMQTQGAGFVDPFAFSAGAILGLLGIGFGSPGNPHILVRYMSLKNVSEMRQAALISSLWNVIMGWGAVMIGIIGRVYFPEVDMLPDGNHEAIFTSLGQELLSPLLMGVLLVAILAAIMSSADSQLLVGASALVRDIYDKLIHRGEEISQTRLVAYSRLATASIMLLAVLLAFSAETFVFWLVLFAWGGLGACFGPVLLLTLYWKKLTRQGSLWGMLAGLIAVLMGSQQPAWTYAFLPDINNLFATILFGITNAAVPGFLISALVAIVVSQLTYRETNDQTATER
ncbi:sodium/proline symporter [Halomonas sp. ML-15]|uniref:sodium/proline symporter n=1 Tax=Halomonas sp. ML-15 TaxID=2773305 RepID=UPI001747379F|nr:sodium/proline symporter [Halomonas sp. ML-15]MBD3897678.1 sodium/proline symporter [Halomonas sp. ML-15]